MEHKTYKYYDGFVPPQLSSLGVGSFAFQFAGNVDGAPTHVPGGEAGVYIRLPNINNTKLTIAIGLSSAAVSVRKNDDSSWVDVV